MCSSLFFLPSQGGALLITGTTDALIRVRAERVFPRYDCINNNKKYCVYFSFVKLYPYLAYFLYLFLFHLSLYKYISFTHLSVYPHLLKVYRIGTKPVRLEHELLHHKSTVLIK